MAELFFLKSFEKNEMEAQTGFEPAFLSETLDLQSSTLPLGHRAIFSILL